MRDFFDPPLRGLIEANRKMGVYFQRIGDPGNQAAALVGRSQ